MHKYFREPVIVKCLCSGVQQSEVRTGAAWRPSSPRSPAPTGRGSGRRPTRFRSVCAAQTCKRCLTVAVCINGWRQQVDKHFGKILFLLQAEAIQAGSDCTVDYKKNILKWLMAFKYASVLFRLMKVLDY